MDGVYYSTEVPTGIKTKTYTVYYKAKGDDNHQDAEAATINVTIKGKKVTSPTITVTPSTFTYDGTEKEPDVTVKDGEAVIDFHIIVAYGVNIKTVADNLMENVIYRVENFIGLKVKRVNVFVEGVRVVD